MSDQDEGNGKSDTPMQPSTGDRASNTDGADSALAPAPQRNARTTLREQRGILMVLTGDGKGKSTSAFGAVVRALGWGHKVANSTGTLILSPAHSISASITVS